MNFDCIWSFIVEYWQEILSAGALIITVVFYIIKRRPVYNGMDAIYKDVLELLPELICAVEIDGNGQRKKNAVIDAVKTYVQRKYKIDIPSALISICSTQIERILSTPQKKGDSENG